MSAALRDLPEDALQRKEWERQTMKARLFHVGELARAEAATDADVRAAVIAATNDLNGPDLRHSTPNVTLTPTPSELEDARWMGFTAQDVIEFQKPGYGRNFGNGGTAL